MSLQAILTAGAAATVLLLQGSVYADTTQTVAEEVESAQTFYSEEWTGTCANGTNLSPIDVQATTPVPGDEWISDFGFGTYSGAIAHSTGHSLQLLFGDIEAGSAPTAAVMARGNAVSDLFSLVPEGELTAMKVTPLQMHWHAPSEHAVNGVFFAAEGHIVTAIAEGEAPAEWGCDAFWVSGNASDLVLEKCIAVFGVLYSLGEATTPPIFANLIANQPLDVGGNTALGSSVDMSSFLPERKDYITYRGSLTTPPCAQGLRWHLFDEPMTITAEDQQQLYQNQADTFITGAPNDTLTYKANSQYIQDLNDRTVYRIGEAASIASSTEGVDTPGVEAEAADSDSSAALPNMQAGLAAIAALAMYLL